MRNLRGHVAIVTGASMGIGAAIARCLAAEGCHVVLAARSADRIERLAAEIQAESAVTVLAIPTDVSDPAQIDHLVERCESELGGVDILVNNAGLGIYGDVVAMQEDDLRYVFDVNFFGAVRAMQAVAPAMRRRGGGTIVNVSSIAGRIPIPLGGGYAATKFALEAVSQAARAELKRDNIEVVVVRPGITRTDFSAHSRLGLSNAGRIVGESLSPIGGVAPERVAQRTVRAMRRGERNVYVTWVDRALVTLAFLTPGLVDWGSAVAAAVRRSRFVADTRGVPGRAEWLTALHPLPALLGTLLLAGALWQALNRRR